MVEHPSHAAAIRGPSRLRRPGLTIKTNLPDTTPSDSKSQTAASTNWRRRAGAVSSPGAMPQRRTMTKSKLSCGASDSLGSTDLENLSLDLVHYRRPKEKQAPWELVVSAPPWQLPASPFTAAALGLGDVTAVQLTQVSPMVVRVNGEDVALPNRFFLDVAPVDPKDPPPHVVLGELHQLKVPTKFRPISSEDSNHLLVELKGLIASAQDTPTCSSATLLDFQASSVHLGPPKSSLDASSTAPGLSTSENGAHRDRTTSLSEEELRFQRMLTRLQKDAEPQHPSRKAPCDTTASLRGSLVDPAIVAMKIKERVEVPGVGRNDRAGVESVNDAGSTDSDHVRSVERQHSGDSGYVSNEGEQHTSVRPTNSGLRVDPGQTPVRFLDGQPTKGLNPAAAEFRSVRGDGLACLSPKKISRPPLTNIFPGALLNSLPLPSSLPMLDGMQALPRHLEQATSRTINSTAVTGVVPHTLHGVLQPPSLNPARNSVLPGSLPPTDALHRQTLPHMPVPVTATAATTAPLAPNFATYPSVTTSNAPISIATLNLPQQPTTTAFNTFPMAPGTVLPVLPQPTALPALNPSLAPASIRYPTSISTTSATICTSAPNPVAVVPPLADPKTNRPYFPVTTKPRDHDPVKQQLYEAYLEWRKANEPGYHMKCKMRQAQRVVRQFQQQQQQQQQQQKQQQQEKEKPQQQGKQREKLQGDGDALGSATAASSWKAIAEKAKAAVGAVAAAAKEEERARKEGVREELRAKVRELSAVSGGNGNSAEEERSVTRE
ncbi:hypothetical protein VTK26DRAFT_4394 [Humicola hyalothermophila]